MLALCLAMAGSASSGAATPVFKTDDQAAAYLSHGFKSWAGIRLSSDPHRSAFCLNGYDSREKEAHG